MLTYLLSGAVALVVGGAGGFLGGRFAISGLRRDHVAFVQETGLVAQELRSANSSTREGLTPFLQAVSQLTASAVTREQLRPVLQELITRQELDLALSTVVEGLSRSSGGLAGFTGPRAAITTDGVVVGAQYPAGRPEQVAPAALGGLNSDQLATALASLGQQVNQINQQLGLG